MIVIKKADGWYWRARLAGRQQEGGQMASRSIAVRVFGARPRRPGRRFRQSVQLDRLWMRGAGATSRHGSAIGQQNFSMGG